MKITLSDIKENERQNYVYFYYVSNTKTGEADRVLVKTSPDKGKLVLDIDPEKAGSNFKLKDENRS